MKITDIRFDFDLDNGQLNHISLSIDKSYKQKNQKTIICTDMDVKCIEKIIDRHTYDHEKKITRSIDNRSHCTRYIWIPENLMHIQNMYSYLKYDNKSRINEHRISILLYENRVTIPCFEEIMKLGFDLTTDSKKNHDRVKYLIDHGTTDIGSFLEAT